MKTSRRILLQTLAAGAAAAVARPALAQNADLGLWYPPSSGGAYTPRKVLEIFLRGAASLYSSFWRDTTLGGAAGTGDSTLTTPEWQAITGGGAPTVHNFGTGQLGTAAGPLFRLTGGRKLADHTRVIRVRHELATHEAGIAYAMTGSTLGRAELSGLGAAIWRRDVENTNPASVGIRSLVFQTGGELYDDQAGLHGAATGVHGAHYRPPVLRLGDDDFYAALPRAVPKLSDDLKKFYRNRYSDLFLYTHPTTGEVFDVRSAGFAAYQASLDAMQAYHLELESMLAPYQALLFQPLATKDTHTSNYTRFAIDSAISLLMDPTHSLQHVAVIDGGVESDYDTHTQADDRIIQNGNIWNVCDSLADRLDDIIDGQLVVLIHSEFGRKEKGGGTDGTEHHTRGYTNVVISDLVPTLSGGFAGDIGGLANDEAEHAEGSPVTPGLTPTDVHAAVAQLAGIEPWQYGMFDRDLACLKTADAAAELLEVV
jgi:hypothetical protein